MLAEPRQTSGARWVLTMPSLLSGVQSVVRWGSLGLAKPLPPQGSRAARRSLRRASPGMLDLPGMLVTGDRRYPDEPSMPGLANLGMVEAEVMRDG